MTTNIKFRLAIAFGSIIVGFALFYLGFIYFNQTQIIDQDLETRLASYQKIVADCELAKTEPEINKCNEDLQSISNDLKTIEKELANRVN